MQRDHKLGGVFHQHARAKVGKLVHALQNSNDTNCVSSRVHASQRVSPPSHGGFKATLKACRHLFSSGWPLEIRTECKLKQFSLSSNINGGGDHHNRTLDQSGACLGNEVLEPVGKGVQRPNMHVRDSSTYN